jgi:hypothetical protein
MIGDLHRSKAKLSITLLLLVSLIALAAPSAAAFNGSENKDKDNLNGGRSEAEPESPLFFSARSNAFATVQPEIILPADHPQLEGMLNRAASVKAVVPVNVKPAAVKRLSTIPLPATTRAASTAPMTAGEKFKSWAKRFWSPGAYGGAVARGMWNELWDNDDNKEDTVGNYFADSMTRAARSYAFGTTAGFFEKFAYPVIFKQDPRYHRSDKRGTGAKIKYAVSRVFITQGDRCGCDQFNVSFIAGGLTAAGIANVWEREERRGWSNTMTRWGYHTAFKAIGNILREFIGGQ